MKYIWKLLFYKDLLLNWKIFYYKGFFNLIVNFYEVVVFKYILLFVFFEEYIWLLFN